MTRMTDDQQRFVLTVAIHARNQGQSTAAAFGVYAVCFSGNDNASTAGIPARPKDDPASLLNCVACPKIVTAKFVKASRLLRRQAAVDDFAADDGGFNFDVADQLGANFEDVVAQDH